MLRGGIVVSDMSRLWASTAVQKLYAAQVTQDKTADEVAELVRQARESAAQYSLISSRIALTQQALAEAERKADEAMRLAREQGWTLRQIGAAAGCSHVTVSKRLARYEAKAADDA